MDKPQNKFLSVVYQLYSVAENGEKHLEEQTGDDRPFEFITGFGISLDRFEQEVSGLEKGSHFDFILQPGEAFGDYVPEGKHKVSRESVYGKSGENRGRRRNSRYQPPVGRQTAELHRPGD